MKTTQYFQTALFYSFLIFATIDLVNNQYSAWFNLLMAFFFLYLVHDTYETYLEEIRAENKCNEVMADFIARNRSKRID